MTFERITCHLVKHPDLNSTTNLFGGQLLSWLDEAAAIYAAEVSKQVRVVTVHMNNIQFRTPVALGSRVNIYCKLAKFGDTSVTIEVEARVVPSFYGMVGAHERVITNSSVTFVCVDEYGDKISHFMPHD